MISYYTRYCYVAVTATGANIASSCCDYSFNITGAILILMYYYV